MGHPQATVTAIRTIQPGRHTLHWQQRIVLHLRLGLVLVLGRTLQLCVQA